MKEERLTIYMQELFAKRYSDAEIFSKKQIIQNRLSNMQSNMSGNSITKLSEADLQDLFDGYDQMFFVQAFQNQFKGKLKFSLSPRLVKSAGKTLCPKHIAKMKPEDVTIEIRMGTDFFFKFHDIKGEKKVCGILTKSPMEALMTVFEHELCHAIEFLVFHNSNCKGKRFKNLAGNLFGHLESTHQLPTIRQIALETYGFNIGDSVSFFHKQQKLTGMLYNIQKRATVMVMDTQGALRDRKGNRYTKYYVPVKKLEKQI